MAIPSITNNSPSAGYIAWGAFHIQLNGIGYTVAAGSTNQRWVWWEYRNGAPIMNAGPEVPSTLVDEDLVLFGNKNGIGVRVQSSNFIDGELLVDGSIFAEALSTNLINSQHIVTAGLDAGTIKFGTMSGDRIEAGTLQITSIANLQASLDAKAGTIVGTGTNRVIQNPLVWQEKTPNLAGKIVITTPITPSAKMTKIELRGYNYLTGVSDINLSLAGYLYKVDSFLNMTQVNRGTLKIVATLAVNAAGTIDIVLETADGSTWQYPEVHVVEAAMSYTAFPDAWATSGWSAQVLTALPAYSYSTVPTRVDQAEGAQLALGWRVTGKTTIAGGQIETDSILAGAIKAQQIDTTKIVAAGLDAGVIKFGSMSGARITAQTIDSGHIVTAGLDAGTIKFGTMSGARITAGTIDSTHIVTAGLDAGKIKFGSMSGALITSGTLDAGKITFGTMSGDRITAYTLDSTKIVTAGLDAGVIKFGSMSGARITANTLDAGTLKSGSAFTNDLSVASTFTLGTATAGGVFQSYNFAGSTAGFQLTNTGFTLKGGTIVGSSLATEPSPAGYFIQTINNGDRPTLQFNISAARDQPSIQSDTGGAPNLFLYSGASLNGRETEINLGQGIFRVGIEATADDQLYSGAVLNFQRDFVYIGSDTTFKSGSWRAKMQFDGTGTYMGYEAPDSGWLRGFQILAGDGSARVLTDNSLSILNGDASHWNDLVAQQVISQGGGIYMNDLTGGGNTQANIGNGGRIQRASSSKRYKSDIMPMSIAIARRALDLKSVFFKLINEGDVSPDKRITYPGMIAEQAHEIGMTNWVSYTPDGRPDGFRYAELTSAHNMLIKELYSRIEKLEKKAATPAV